MRIVVLGNLCGRGAQLAGALGAKLVDHDHGHLDLLGADLIVSLSARLSARVYYPLTYLKPYIAYATGSDLRELAMTDSPAGRRAASYFQRACFTIMVQFDRKIRAAARSLDLKTTDHKFTVGPADDGEIDCEIMDRVQALHGRYVAYLPATQHWSVKGNDVALKALAQRPDIAVIAREHGPDLAEAKRMLPEALWLPNTNPATFRAICREVNVVLDQFAGGHGLIALEAMYEGTPVITCTGEWPVLNATTPEEVLGRLPYATHAHGQRSALWVQREHGPEQLQKLGERIRQEVGK